MRQGVCEDAHERLLACLTVYPFQRILVYEVAGILLAVFKVLVSTRNRCMLYVLLQSVNDDMLVTILLGVIAIQEVGIVCMRLELADITIVSHLLVG